MRLRSFKRGLQNAMEKASKQLSENQCIMVMINHEMDQEIVNYLEEMKIPYQKFPDDMVAKNDVKLTIVDTEKPTIGFIKK